MTPKGGNGLESNRVLWFGFSFGLIWFGAKWVERACGLVWLGLIFRMDWFCSVPSSVTHQGGEGPPRILAVARQ